MLKVEPLPFITKDLEEKACRIYTHNTAREQELSTASKSEIHFNSTLLEVYQVHLKAIIC